MTLENMYPLVEHGAADKLATAMETATETESEASEEETQLDGHEK